MRRVSKPGSSAPHHPRYAPTCKRGAPESPAARAECAPVRGARDPCGSHGPRRPCARRGACEPADGALERMQRAGTNRPCGAHGRCTGPVIVMEQRPRDRRSPTRPARPRPRPRPAPAAAAPTPAPTRARSRPPPALRLDARAARLDARRDAPGRVGSRSVLGAGRRSRRFALGLAVGASRRRSRTIASGAPRDLRELERRAAAVRWRAAPRRRPVTVAAAAVATPARPRHVASRARWIPARTIRAPSCSRRSCVRRRTVQRTTSRGCAWKICRASARPPSRGAHHGRHAAPRPHRSIHRPTRTRRPSRRRSGAEARRTPIAPRPPRRRSRRRRTTRAGERLRPGRDEVVAREERDERQARAFDRLAAALEAIDERDDAGDLVARRRAASRRP